ncbi:MAG: succinate dehydrogenase cytochrome b subunit [Deltaproteobacteria bacterium]|nr:succinate dehydrogenase cytochrome b subunit [Deltaproteobacteria bacterium]
MTSRTITLLGSTVGKKAVMGATGLILFGFVFIHMAANLQLWMGPGAMNGYAATLRKVHGVLWIARAVLLASVVLHIWALVGLRARNARARPVPYRHERKDQAPNLAATTMILSGLGLFCYILYHILHLTFGVGPSFDHQNVYNNVVYGFQNPAISAVYVMANLLLGLHLFHGGAAWLNSLGLNHPRYNARLKSGAMLLALAITAGNVLIPLSVLTGMVKPTDERFCYEELAKTKGECDGFVK